MKQNEMFGKNNRKKKERRVRNERNKEDEWPQSKGRGRTAVEDARQTGIKKRHETLTHTQENNTNQHQPPHFGDVSRSLRGADLAKYTCPLLPRAPFRPPPLPLGSGAGDLGARAPVPPAGTTSRLGRGGTPLWRTSCSAATASFRTEKERRPF